MYYQAIMWSLLLLVVTGCAREEILIPAPTAQDVPGTLYTAQATQTGVRVTVSSNKWSGHPATLEDHLTALHVAMVNDSGRPLRLRYNEFKLVNPSGMALTALPPLRIEETVRVPVQVVPRFAYTRFWVAPFYARYYRGISPWWGPFDYDPLHYDGYYRYWRQPLPTEDMLEQTIPEGVLEDEGRVSGFLYFSERYDETDRVNFVVELVDASTGENFGRILMPFLVKEI